MLDKMDMKVSSYPEVIRFGFEFVVNHAACNSYWVYLSTSSALLDRVDDSQVVYYPLKFGTLEAPSARLFVVPSPSLDCGLVHRKQTNWMYLDPPDSCSFQTCAS